MMINNPHDEELLKLIKFFKQKGFSLNHEPKTSDFTISAVEKTLIPFMNEQACKLDKPEFSPSIDYLKEYLRMFLMKEALVSTFKEVSMQKVVIEQKMKNYDSLYSEFQNLLEPHRNQRRTASEIVKNYTCPYQSCFKSYGTEVALNLHIKKKHKGGNKSDREDFAREFFLSLRLKKPLPKTELILPNEFMERVYVEFKRIQENGFIEVFEPSKLFEKKVMNNHKFTNPEKQLYMPEPECNINIQTSFYRSLKSSFDSFKNKVKESSRENFEKKMIDHDETNILLNTQEQRIKTEQVDNSSSKESALKTQPNINLKELMKNFEVLKKRERFINSEKVISNYFVNNKKLKVD